MNRSFCARTTRVTVLLAFAALAPLAVAAQLPAQVAKVSTAQSRQLRQLLGEYYLANARFEPLGRTFAGDSRFDDQLGMSIGPHERARQFALYRTFVARLHTINADGLAAADRTSYDILDFELASALALEPFPDHLLPIDQMNSIPSLLANLASGDGSQPISTPKQYRSYLARITQLSDWIDQAIVNMREGMKIGVVQPTSLIVSALPQFQKLVSVTPEASVFYTPIKNLPANFSRADRSALIVAYRTEIANRLNPALTKLARFLETEYLPAGRSSSGLGAMPNGDKWYLAKVADATTTTLLPDQIHAIGLKEVARIQEQFAVLGPKMGYTGPAAGLPKWVAAQDKFRPFKSAQEVLEVYRKLDATLGTKLATLFRLTPKAPLDLRLEPELTRATASDHYTPPSADGARPGVFWSVVNDPTQYDSTRMTTLFLHEGRPGHHFQLAFQLEQKLPDFRKFGGNNAYIEGWALYAETLGSEMGLYEDPVQYFGHLNAELVRAVRLVVDTGMHSKGWTREQAIQYLRETNGYGEARAKSQIERYMALPGQALGYKVGSMKIMELRQRATAALGAKFSLPAFHAVVLGDGTLPLAVLEAKVDRWIADVGGKNLRGSNGL